MSLTRTLIMAGALALIGTPAFAHGGGAESRAGHPGQPKDVTRTVTIELREYAFNPASLAFKAGETVKFVVKNTGTLKHELTIGTAEEQEKHRAEMKEMSDMKHSEGMHGGMPSSSVHVDPGETRELIWTFTQSGTLDIACNYPGHADLGMEGKIAVQ